MLPRCNIIWVSCLTPVILFLKDKKLVFTLCPEADRNQPCQSTEGEYK